jgi:hypothetical protein
MAEGLEVGAAERAEEPVVGGADVLGDLADQRLAFGRAS